MSTALAERPHSGLAAKVEQVLIGGDLSKLTTEERLSYYNRVCESLGLNPLTKPFAFLTLSGKTVLYALKDATEQLRKRHGVSITEITSQRVDDVFVVTAKAMDRDGRTDAATGAVSIANLKGEALANALMKAETKAKRRATLSICGLGMLDETETETIPAEPTPRVFENARILHVTPKSKGNVAWAEVTFATDAGEEVTLPTAADAKEAAVNLFEQLKDEDVLVTIKTDIGARNKRERISQVTRHRTQAEENALDAEIAAKDAAF